MTEKEKYIAARAILTGMGRGEASLALLTSGEGLLLSHNTGEEYVISLEVMEYMRDQELIIVQKPH